ncbi:transcription factor HIVEP3 [Callorhinchus milii]|uniref:transcription factor HIVEP3 n=1 Tax=Callorhinchus milii TaxID=7868 RepID=UPI001C3FC960|nr:transcription factor HIVEP3 [Callorhinchus milii]
MPSSELAHQHPPPKQDPPKHPSAYPYDQPRHVPQLLPQATPPAFMAVVKPEPGLERRSWQRFDPRGSIPIPSGPFGPPGFHPHSHLIPHQTSIIPKEEPQAVYGHQAAQVTSKQEETGRKDKKPPKPGKYICQFCGRPCAKPSVLQKHIRSHTGERPYPCHSCGFSFKTKSNLYKHRKSHAHKLKAGLVLGGGVGEAYVDAGTGAGAARLELEKVSGDEPEEHTEGDESTDSEDELSGMSGHSVDLTPHKHKHIPGSVSLGSQELSPPHGPPFTSQTDPSWEEGSRASESSLDLCVSHKAEDSHSIKQKLALRLSERRRALADEQTQTFLSPGSKGSTESGYFSRSESAEQQMSPPQTSAKSYAEIILGKYGRYGQRTSMIAATATQGSQHMPTEEKPSTVSFPVHKTQMEQNVIEHITKLITINEAVVDTRQIDSVKPRRTSLSRRGSLESPKAGTSREAFQFDLKSLGLPSGLGTDPGSRFPFGDGAATSRLAHGSAETVPLTRSNSMPSEGSAALPHAFKGSYSFDDRMMGAEGVLRGSGHSLASHHRMLRRQKAIELPSGMDYQSEEGSAKESPAQALILAQASATQLGERDAGQSDLVKKTRRGPRAKGLMYECDICGARYRKRNNYETHKKYYCSELHGPKGRPYLSRGPRETEAGPHQAPLPPQVMHYKLGRSELTQARKRRKEKSLGDDEEIPTDYSSRSLSSYEAPAPCATVTFSQAAPPPSPPPHTHTDIPPSTQSVKSLAPGECRQAAEASLGSDAAMRSIPSASATAGESGGKRATGKEISVIQHTNALSRPGSFENQESLVQESVPLAAERSGQKIPESEASWQPPARHHHHHHPSLVRQHKIQVPEILVTEEPDKPERVPEPVVAKEPEKPIEEFQWPQRSQTLAQFPAEKLPPKKKRLRLAELSQSSGDSSFESSISLTRSPSQESSVSHASSRSASFDREELGKGEGLLRGEVSCQPGELRGKPSAGLHTLAVPASHYSHHREMRRCSSEQAPAAQHPSEGSEPRSKSFDYGSLSSEPPSSSLPIPSLSPLKERRRCFLVRQASLSSYTDPEPDPKPVPRHEQAPPPSLSAQAQTPRYLSPPPPPPPPPSLPHSCQPGDSHSELPEIYTHSHSQLTQVSSQPLFPAPHHQGWPLPVTTEVLSAQLVPPLSYHLFPSPQLPVHLQVAAQLLQHPIDLSTPLHPTPLHPAPTLVATAPFPLRPHLALQLHPDPGPPFREQKRLGRPPAPPPSSSSSPPFRSQPEPALPLPLITHFPEALPPLAPVVVPVRVQTHMPTYGTAMYTTLSQMLVTQSMGSPSTVVLCRVEDSRAKGTVVCTPAGQGLSLNLSQIITSHHRDVFQAPYLRIPFPMTERKGYATLGSPADRAYASDCYPSAIGGSKRMLSPAGSLELTMESQQQKRVKEEEIEEEPEEKSEPEERPTAIPSGPAVAGRLHKPLATRQCVESKASPTLTCQEWDSGSKLTVPTQQSTGSSEKYQLWPGSQYSSKASLATMKKEEPETTRERSSLQLQEPQQPTSSTSEDTPSPFLLTDVSDVQQVLHFPSLHTTTNVSWCYLNYIKPNHEQQTDRRASVYASWCISLYNPNLPGMSTKLSLALLRSKQRTSREMYTMAAVSRRDTGKLVPSSTRKPRVSEIHAPSLHSGEGRKDTCKIEKEEERKEKHEDDTSVPKRMEPSRIRIFEGGYKSNEDYVYVRGRGRGKYVCEECGIRCKKPSMLKKHIRTHTDLRPYVCSYCNFAFKTKGNLTKHMKSKAHSKKCQEMGVTVALMEELESEEGTSEEKLKKAEESEGTDATEEHQFSDVEDSDDDEDNDDEDEEEEEESQEELSSEMRSVSPNSLGTITTFSKGESLALPLDTISKQEPLLTTHYSLMSYSMSSSHLHAGQLMASSELGTVPVCYAASYAQLEGSSPMSPLTSPERLTSSHREASARDASPKRQWSPKREVPSGSRLSPEREEPSPGHRQASSSQCFSPGKELSPGRAPSPRRRPSPGREVSPKRCSSPRTETSPRREVSPGRPSSPERKGSPGVAVSTRYLSLWRDASPRRRASPVRTRSPRKEESPDARCQSPPRPSGQSSSFLTQQSGAPSAALPPGLPGKELEPPDLQPKTWRFGQGGLYEEVCPPPLAWCPHPTRTLPSGSEGQSEAWLGFRPRAGGALFSHLPLHSQQLVRTPYPMIPIGGIQMVQARPGGHPQAR